MDFDMTQRYYHNCSSSVITEAQNEAKCSLSDWPWYSCTGVWQAFILATETELNESLLLDELTIFGQIGGNAGKWWCSSQ